MPAASSSTPESRHKKESISAKIIRDFVDFLIKNKCEVDEKVAAAIARGDDELDLDEDSDEPTSPNSGGFLQRQVLHPKNNAQSG